MVLKERDNAHPEDNTMLTNTAKTFNKLYIIKNSIVKQEKLQKAQLEMAKKKQA